VAARLTAAEKRLRSISEADWQSTVVDIAKRHGWLHYHAPANRPVHGRIQNVVAGYPDLHLIRGPRSVFAELKAELGTVTPQQTVWLDSLAAAGHEAHIWRPRDIGHVLEVLA
jgi:hypothetical protein